MYSSKRETVKKINHDMNNEIARKEMQLDEQRRERELKRASIREMANRGKQ